MKKIIALMSIVTLAAGVANAQNLLNNPNFNSPISAADWTTWSYGGGYSSQEVPTLVDHGHDNTGIYDGTLQMTMGAANTSGGGGVFQIVSANAGLTYDLSVQAGAQAWWLPTGQIRLFFLDAGNVQLGLTQINTTDGIHSPDQYDVGVVYQGWNLSATAPTGTTQAKVEFAGFGGGSAWFDNAVLTVVPEPSTLAMLALGSVGIVGGRRMLRRK